VIAFYQEVKLKSMLQIRNYIIQKCNNIVKLLFCLHYESITFLIDVLFTTFIYCLSKIFHNFMAKIHKILIV